MKKVKLFYGNQTSFSIDSELLPIDASVKEINETKEFFASEVEIQEDKVERYLELALALYRLKKGRHSGKKSFEESEKEINEEMAALLA